MPITGLDRMPGSGLARGTLFDKELNVTTFAVDTGTFSTAIVLQKSGERSYTITWTSPTTTDRALTIPDVDQDDVFVFATETQAISNKALTLITDLDMTAGAKTILDTIGNANLTIGASDTTVVIQGNLTVSGTTTTIDTTNLTVVDPLISLAKDNNSSDIVDIGIYGLYDTSGSQDLYGGLFRDANDSGKWKLFKDLQAVPTTTVNTGGTGYAAGTLVATLEGNADTATLATTVTITDNEDTSETNAVIFTAGGATGGGSLGLESDGDFTYNPSSGTVAATTFSGALSGNASTATALAATGNIAATGDIAWNVDFSGSNVTAAATIQSGAVETAMLNNNVISGQTEITSGLVVADELLYSDGGVIKKIGIDNFIELAPTLATEDAVADGDYILFLDGGATGNMNKEAVHDLATLFAGTGLTASSSVIGVDASQTQITAVGTITSGTWGTGAVIGGATITLGSDATGDVYYRNASGVLTRLAAGSDADVLTLASGIPSWATPTVGDITGVTAGNGLSGGGTSGGVSLALDLSELSDTAIAHGDYIVFTDTTDSNASVKGDLADVATLFAGSGLTATNSVIAVDTLNQDTSGTAAIATTVTITDNESTDEDNAIIFTAGGDVDGGNLGLESDGTLTYNPSTGKITATGFIGALTGNVTGDVTGDVTGTADTATVATTVTITDNESTNEENAVVFTAGGDVDGGNLGLESDGDLTYNPSSGTLTATAFAGALTGNVTGNASGTAATVTTAAQTNITSLGTLTTLTVDDITINGSTISDAGDFTLDVDGDITIDANGGQINFKDNGNTSGALFNVASASDTAAVMYSRVGDPNTGMYMPADDTIGFVAAGSEVVKIIDDGVLINYQDGILDTGLTRVEANTSVAALQVGSLDNAGCAIFSRFSADTNGFRLKFLKSRAAAYTTTPSDSTRPSANDQIGQIWWGVDDGTDNTNVYTNTSARIIGEVDGTIAQNLLGHSGDGMNAVNDNDTPGRLTFWTTADGAGSASERMRINHHGSVLIGDTSNANQLGIGLTINQGTATDEAITLKSTDFGGTTGDGTGHDMTAQTESDTFGVIKRSNGNLGGLLVRGFGSATRGLQLVGSHTTDVTSKDADANSHVVIRAETYDGGTSTTTPSDTNTNILTVRGPGSTVGFIFALDGDLFYDGTTNAEHYDDYDDIALLDTVRAVTTKNYKGVFSKFTEENAQILDKAGIITMNDDGHHFVSTKGLNGLIIDSIRQLSMRTQEGLEEFQESLEELKEENKKLKQKLEALEE